MTARATEPMFGWRPAHHAPPKLTSAQREEICFRRGAGESSMSLALKYGVSARTIDRHTPRQRP